MPVIRFAPCLQICSPARGPATCVNLRRWLRWLQLETSLVLSDDCDNDRATKARTSCAGRPAGAKLASAEHWRPSGANFCLPPNLLALRSSPVNSSANPQVDATGLQFAKVP